MKELIYKLRKMKISTIIGMMIGVYVLFKFKTIQIVILSTYKVMLWIFGISLGAVALIIGLCLMASLMVVIAYKITKK